jgi:subtilisin family serine protease
LIVAAAGNNRGVSGRDFPGAYDDVLAATAVDSGLNVYAYASLGDHVDFSAPGVSIRTASGSGADVLSGTSFATPFLTAAVAIATRSTDRLGPDGMRRIISSHSRDLGRTGVDQVYGHGLLDCLEHDFDSNGINAPIARGLPAGPRLLAAN